MKRFRLLSSIKGRVTLWYTGFLLLMMALALAYLLIFSQQVLHRQLSTRLKDVVSDTVRDAHFQRGQLQDDRMDFYKDGVSIFIYDTQGRLLAPKINQGVQVDALLEDQVVKEVENNDERFFVYDLYAVRDNIGFWVRGICTLTGATGTIRGMFQLALLAIPTVVLVAGLGGWFITKRSFAVMGRMADTVNAIASGEDLTQRIPDDGSGDELSRLSHTVNGMLERLQRSFENQRRFTSDVSHELRTPTSVIISQCEYGLSPETSPEERENCLRGVLSQAQRMSTMIGQLLMLARGDNGKFEPTWEQVDLSLLCELCAAQLEEKAQEKKVSLETGSCEGAIIVGDETLLIRLVTNLLSNAIQYNRPGGKVSLWVEKKENGFLIKFQDTGIGIAPEDLEKIWERFYRADPSRTGEGTSLGLPMVHWIVKIHGGKVTVESIQGMGSVFSVWLPQHPPSENQS